MNNLGLITQLENTEMSTNMRVHTGYSTEITCKVCFLTIY